MHLRKVIRLLSFIQIFIAALMLLPALIGIIHGESPAVTGFFITIFIMSAPAATAIFFTRHETMEALSQKDGFLFTTLTWITATAFGALPLVISGDFADYHSAFFEIMSGFTTTGATTLSNIEGCFKSILFWRSMTNWLGGMGIVVLFVALLPALDAGAGSFHLIGAESVGPVKGKLTPKTKNTALALWAIYIGFTVLEVVFLLFGGLSLYDAVTVSFSTLSAAGFCVKNASIGAFDSAYVEVVVTVFMLVAGINFALYYKAFSGKLKDAAKDSEMRWFLAIFSGCAVLGAASLAFNGVYSPLTALRHMAFQTASILTTTGFSTANYLNWPTFAAVLLVMTMFIGGCAGSAGGGMKVVRVSVICKSGVNVIKKKVHPAAMCKLRDSNGIIDQETAFSIFSFCAVYIITWIAGTVVISLTGTDIETCLASTLLTLGNVGIGFGKVGPAGNFGMFPGWSKWVFSFLMLAGRLELFTVYVLFSKAFWKK